MKNPKRGIVTVSLAALVCLIAVGVGRATADASSAKYVFFFIGDGMAGAQINVTEAYLANKVEHDDVGGSKKAELLKMSRLPVHGMSTTFPWNSTITDSASAATALATGKKTADGVISMDPTTTTSYPSIAELAKAAGMKVGIISSVSLDHATPACFYAHEPSRSNYHNIGRQLVGSGFDFFGGGGLKHPEGVHGNLLNKALAAGYVIADTKDKFDALMPGRKAIAFNPVLDQVKNRQALYYAIDRSYTIAADPAQADNHLSLAQFTHKAIRLLDNPKGFFLMVEGGKVDWACHANDGRTVIDEMLAFDEAVGVAIEFMKRRPARTLIVVTGDHETGGLAIGWAGTGTESHLEQLEAQKVSHDEFGKIWAAYQTACGGPACPDDIQDDLKALFQDFFGLHWATLTDLERKRLEEAYDKSLGRVSGKLPEEDALLYSSHTPITVTVTHILNNRVGIGWTSYSHTGLPVPVMAGGCGASAFNGYYDNTAVAKKLARAMRLNLPN